MVTVSATERPQGERSDESQPRLVLRDELAGTGSAARRGLAARRHKTWESRFKAGQGPAGAASDEISRGTGWGILRYLLAGMTVYGGPGWGIGPLYHPPITFPGGLGCGAPILLG